MSPAQTVVGEVVGATDDGCEFNTRGIELIAVLVPAHPATVALIVYAPASVADNGLTLAVVNEFGLIISEPPGPAQV